MFTNDDLAIPQTAHSPLINFLWFFVVTCDGLSVAVFALHLTQYDIILCIKNSTQNPLYRYDIINGFEIEKRIAFLFKESKGEFEKKTEVRLRVIFPRKGNNDSRTWLRNR